MRHKALVVAYGVHETGRREVIGIDVGEAETEAFWREFLRGLLARGLDGVLLRLRRPRGLRRSRPLAGIPGAPGRIRTCDPRIRSPTLYPAELRARDA